MHLLGQGRNDRLSIQPDPMDLLHLFNDGADMQGLLRSLEYVFYETQIRPMLFTRRFPLLSQTAQGPKLTLRSLDQDINQLLSNRIFFHGTLLNGLVYKLP
jgi:hypothetical protein